MKPNFDAPRSRDAGTDAPQLEGRESEFSRILGKMLGRRRFLNVATTGAAAAAAGAGLGCVATGPRPGAAAGSAVGRALDFTPIPPYTGAGVVVPEEYSHYVLASWGQPLNSHANTPKDPVERQRSAIGENNDGMECFTLADDSGDGERVLLALNNEYTDPRNFYSPVRKPSHQQIRVGQLAHGVSIFEIEKNDRNQWQPRRGSKYNRRITPETPMDITGPARGHALMRTVADPSGTSVLGTFNNCGCGRTPWGSYLTCEENIHLYFSDDRGTASATDRRYGIPSDFHRWNELDRRFDVSSDEGRNEAHRFGYVVEIAPRDPKSTPRKLTALGRLKHENAELVVTEGGRGPVVVYMGDDERGEYLYRFVSAQRYEDLQKSPWELLEKGRLYAARFDDQGNGEWLELSPKATGMSEAEICIFTRMAADRVGATTMDRPEWVAAHPARAELYCSLTNNKNRGPGKTNEGGQSMEVNPANPRSSNHYGHVIRWRPAAENHLARRFSWELFALCGSKSKGKPPPSVRIDLQNLFNAPDGAHFDAQGRLWLQTDGEDSNSDGYQDHGNNQMLVVAPDQSADQDGGQIRRFMAGPKGCEVTGLSWSPDRRTMFVGIQHPSGTEFNPIADDAEYVDRPSAVSRSAVIAIHRKDGGEIG